MIEEAPEMLCHGGYKYLLKPTMSGVVIGHKVVNYLQQLSDIMNTKKVTFLSIDSW